MGSSFHTRILVLAMSCLMALIMLQNMHVSTPDGSDGLDKSDRLSGKYELLQEYIDRRIKKAVQDRVPSAVQPRDTGKQKIAIRFWNYLTQNLLVVSVCAFVCQSLFVCSGYNF